MNTALDAKKQIQGILGTAQDGQIGPKTRAALDSLVALPDTAPWPPQAQGGAVRSGWATSFADPADVAAFRKCKSEGGTDEHCFGIGDNGIGFTGLDCTDESKPYIAIPYEDWHNKFGGAKEAEGKPVLLTVMGIEHECIIGDTMPHLDNITNGAVVDMGPGARKMWGLSAPLKIKASWRWPSA